jgi:hypothetical protein
MLRDGNDIEVEYEAFLAEDVADGLEEEWKRPMHWAGFLVVGAATRLPSPVGVLGGGGVNGVAAEAESVVTTGEEKTKGSGGKIGGLLEMLTKLDLARYLQKLECEEIDLGTLQETLVIGGRPALLQSLESAGVDKAGPRDKIANYLQQLSSA